MSKRLLILGTIALLSGVLAIAAVAQNRGQQRGPGQQAVHQAAVAHDVVTLAGTVTAANLAAGQGMPSITLKTGTGDVTIMIGPYRQLMANQLEIKLGQALEVKAFQDPRFPNAYAATEIKDLASGSVVALRDPAGMPNRGGRGMGRMGGGMMYGGQRMQAMGQCPRLPAGLDEAAKTVLSGQVISASLEPGKGSPTFVLAAGGSNVTVYACPLQLLLRAGFLISAGDQMSVTAYPISNQAGSYIAAELNNLTTQKTLKLR